MEFEIKRLTREGLSGALVKAERYRLLNEPREAESICLDALAYDPDDQDALKTLLLSLTDQFASEATAMPVIVEEARKIVARLRNEYDRLYYTGVIYER